MPSTHKVDLGSHKIWKGLIGYNKGLEGENGAIVNDFKQTDSGDSAAELLLNPRWPKTIAPANNRGGGEKSLIRRCQEQTRFTGVQKKN